MPKPSSQHICLDGPSHQMSHCLLCRPVNPQQLMLLGLSAVAPSSKFQQIDSRAYRTCWHVKCVCMLRLSLHGHQCLQKFSEYMHTFLTHSLCLLRLLQVTSWLLPGLCRTADMAAAF